MRRQVSPAPTVGVTPAPDTEKTVRLKKVGQATAMGGDIARADTWGATDLGRDLVDRIRVVVVRTAARF